MEFMGQNVMRKIQGKCPSVNQSSKVGKREYGPFGNSSYSPFVLVVSIYQARKLQFSCETEKSLPFLLQCIIESQTGYIQSVSKVKVTKTLSFYRKIKARVTPCAKVLPENNVRLKTV